MSRKRFDRGTTRWRGPASSGIARASEHQARLTLGWSRWEGGQELTIGARDIETGKEVEVVLSEADTRKLLSFVIEQLEKKARPAG